ncbi:DUF7507 domain-containing protein [Paenibacillus caseinilyticus]|uniref:DUF7507 domain-containing protein n=1 Tax=Paenibacillus caseinilyticus TaxID=3098138 RepID=UPI0022B8D866|nr:hypothetical protein [Paenibacillus caseinilyticus]MCZ8518554.1 hypothetical protein [Paenibacillus caseinilyticus]
MKIIPLVVRSTLNATGAITFTGNTLGLSRGTSAGTPGTNDSIGAFTTTDSTVRYGTYPLGTTSQYLSNSASAVLTLPAGSTVLYAELIWGATYINGNVNLSSLINNPITLTTPAGTSNITPDTATRNEVDLGSDAFAYVRSANVTSLIQQGGAGTYTVGRVVGTLVINNDPTANHAGWTLGVIYENPSLPFRNMSLRAGAVLVQSTSAAVSTTLTGFATPVTGALGGRALFSAQEGDANRTGDQALFGPTSSTLVALSGPNNFANNFFASQINNDAGQLSTTGTFGTRNQTNGAPGTNISAGRQGWDITNVDISARLVNNQSSAVLQLTTSGDAYVVNANAIQIDINAPKITTAKSASAAGSVVGDVITYTVTVSNTGTASAASVVVSDTLPAGSAFVSGSVTVAGASRPTLDITTGVPVGSLALGTSITLTYRARVASLPSPQQLANQAQAAFTFQSVAGGSVITGVIPSNTVITPVYAPVIGIAKSAGTSAATVGDLVTYTLAVTNTGNVGAAVTVTDNIPAGSAFVPNSVTVGGSTVPGANPAAGVNIGTIAAGGSSTLTFQVQVNALPSPPQLVNQGSAAYSSQVPDGRILTGSAASNTVTIPVTLPNVTAVKSAGVPSAVVGDIVTYTVTAANNGSQSITNVVLSDPLPAGGRLVPGSVTVRGISVSGGSPAAGVALGTIAAGSSAAVTYRIEVFSLPSPAQLSNQASVTYSSGTFQGISVSNAVVTPVYQPVIGLEKSSPAGAAVVGSEIPYVLTVRNTGNLAASVTLTDSLAPPSSFVPGSVTIGGNPSPGASPVTGIPVGTVPPGGAVTVTFRAMLGSLPSPPRLVNQAAAAYTYQPPDGRTLTGSVSSGIVDLPASAPNLTVTKSVSAAEAVLGDVLTYSVLIVNSGAAAAQGVSLSDTAPSGTLFVPGSVTVDGTARPEADPGGGISIGALAPGASASVTFRAQVRSLPNPPEAANQAAVSFTSGAFSGAAFSNIAATAILQPVLGAAKGANRTVTSVGDTFAYFVTVTNTGSAAAEITLTDSLPAGTSFVTNSVIAGDRPRPGVSPLSGIPLGALAAGARIDVTFEVAVTSLPSPQVLVNEAAAAYSFRLSDGRTVSGSVPSNTLTIPVSAPDVSVELSAGSMTGVSGDIIRYTAVIRNSGTAPANNLVFAANSTEGTAFVPGSVTVNGAAAPSADPLSGIPIGTLPAGGAVTVTYEVRITMATPPNINNQSTVSFTTGTFAASSSSNTVVTPVTQPVISLQKSANTSNATVGDTVVYTVVVSNTGNLGAAVTLTDTIPPSATFVPNSVVVGSRPQPDSSPATGIAVGMVAPGQSVAVSFALVIDSLPPDQQQANQAAASFTFTPPDGRTLTRTAASNTVSFPVSSPDVEVVKSSPAIDAVVGDIVGYSVAITNRGIEAVTNVQFTDSVPAGTSYVAGSAAVDGVPVAGDPGTGIAISSIAPGSTVTVTFSVRVNTLPEPAQLLNQSVVSFTSGAFASSVFSNTDVTPVFQPILNLVKSANTSNATVGDTVTYTVNVSNTGNFPAAVTLSDTLPPGTSFAANSVIVNGSPLPGASPGAGFPIGTVAPGAAVPVSFSVLIETLPQTQQIVNQAGAAFTFTPPDGRQLTGSAVSNTVTVPVSSPNVSAVKSTASVDAVPGDIIPYTVVVTNNGIGTVVDNVVVFDALPAGTAFIPGSVKVNGTVLENATPASGIVIGSIAPGDSVTVAFRLQVVSLPSPPVITNRSFVSFTSGAFSGTSISNTVVTPVFQPLLTLTKSANTANASVGGTVVYSVTASNAGNLAAEVILADPIPAGASFVPNSVIVNGSVQPGADPAAGFSIGTVAPGSPVTATFTIVINTLPTNQQLTNEASGSFTYTPPDGRTLTGSAVSNRVTVSVSAPNVGIVKSTPTVDAIFGDTITYTSVLTNTGIADVTGVVFGDPIPAGAVFVPGSVTVGGTPQPGANPAAGIPVGSIAPGTSLAVTFQVTVTSLPAPAVLSNRSSASFTSGTFSGTSFSNIVQTPVFQPLIAVTKSANTSNATVGDTVVYFFSVTNTGNLPANVTLTDSIPSGTAFIPNSVVIDGAPRPGADPTQGIPLGSVAAGETVLVRVSLEVTVDALPSPQQLVNSGFASFTFATPAGRAGTGTAASNILTIPVSAPDVSVVKSADVIDAVVGDTITYTVVVTNNGIAPVNNVVLSDTIPAGTRLVAGSVTVDGASRPADNPGTGVSLPSIAPGASSTVTFQVVVVP